MADIVRIDLTDVSDTLQGTFQIPFRLTSMADDANLILQAGWTEEIGGFLYRVEGGNVTPSGSVASGNTYYIYITEDGDGTATATLSLTAPTYNAVNGGYYNGTSKAIFSAYYDGTNFIYKTRVGYLQGDRLIGELSIEGIIKNAVKNYFSYSTVALLAADMETDGFLSGVYYSAAGYANSGSNTYIIHEISQISGTSINVTGFNVTSGGILRRQPITFGGSTSNDIAAYKIKIQ